jgi:DNA-binding MarR family transcriptional regulator
MNSTDIPDPPGDEPVDHDCIVHLMLAVGSAIQAFKRTHTTAADSDHGAIAIITVLYRCGPVRPSDLAHLTTLDLSTVSRHARSMEAAGHLAKVADPDDRRAHRLALTDTGIELVEELWEQRLTRLSGRLRDWTRQDAQTFAELATRFALDISGTTAPSMPDPETVRVIHRAALQGAEPPPPPPSPALPAPQNETRTKEDHHHE